MMRIVRDGVRKLIGGGVACLFIILSPGAVRGEPEPLYPTVFLDTGEKTFREGRNLLGGTYLGATRINEDGTVEGIWGELGVDTTWLRKKGTFVWDKKTGLRAVDQPAPAKEENVAGWDAQVERFRAEEIPVEGILQGKEWVAGKFRQKADGTWRVFRWSRGKGLEISPAFAGAEAVRVAALTQEGTVAGEIEYSRERGGEAFYWRGGDTVEKSGPLEKGRFVEVIGANERELAGNIVAGGWRPSERYRDVRGRMRAFVWEKGKVPQTLPLLEGVSVAGAEKINAHGQIIGESRRFFDTVHGGKLRNQRRTQSWVWSSEEGLCELGVKVPWQEKNVKQGFWNVNVTDINDAGQIVGELDLNELTIDDGKGMFMWLTSVLWEVPPPGKQTGGVVPAEQVPDKTTPPR